MTVARIEGYASIFNARDMNGDIVAPGAFAAALRARGPDGVRMLYQHAVEAPLGRWTRLKEDARGLYAAGELILETERARDIAALIEGRALDGLSIGFQTVKARKEQGARVILEADLWEISIVTFPMADGARIRALTYPKATDAGEFAATLKSAARVFGGAVRPSPLPWERPKPASVSGEGSAFNDCSRLRQISGLRPLTQNSCGILTSPKGEVRRGRTKTQKPSAN